jgi:transcription-repair coupling factor (superfamily II helicase)
MLASNQKLILNLPKLPADGASGIVWQRLYGSCPGLAVAEFSARTDQLVVAVTDDAQSAQKLFDQIRFFSGADQLVFMFPDWECLPYDQFSPHADIISQRLSILQRIPSLKSGILVLPVSNLLQRLAPRNYIEARSFSMRRGDTVDIGSLRQRLLDLSYHAVGQVLEPGEFSVRGGIIDIFPTGSNRPFRLDLFDEEIDTIRFFDPESQLSTDPVDEISLLPAREMPLDSEGIKRFRQSFRARFTGDPAKFDVYRDVSNGLAPAGVEFYLPLFFERTDSFFDYLPDGAVFVTPDAVSDAVNRAGTEIRDRYELARSDTLRPVLSPELLYLDEAEIGDALARFARVEVASFGQHTDGPGICTLPSRAVPEFHIQPRSESPYQPFFDFLNSTPDRCLLVAESAGRREVLQQLLRDHGLNASVCADWHAFLADDEIKLGLTVYDLELGLRLEPPGLCVITESQLYGNKVLQRRRRSTAARDPESIIRSLSELKDGDPVVHDDHGVGRFQGLKTMSPGGIETEFLVIEYKDGDRLYIPVLNLSVVSRYIGGSPETAPLHKMGSEVWLKAKRRAREKAYDVAAELLEVQAVRKARRGVAFASPDDSYEAFAATFPFEETPDQEQGIDQIIADMVSGKPMDRLVCGDVGFGKTEMALRAAFLAVNSGTQVGILVPTTLLAQQHYQNFSDRFADFPIKVELLSRFRSAKELREALDSIAEGKADIVIGTHKLLQGDVRFKNLGLIIIDEEHRFGVRQKERLKRLRASVDVLTLTATPIPRTLNSALSGLRDISIIATPPRARLSIKTFVRQWNESSIREACLREIRRGGQVYFLHNEVRTIEKQAGELAKLVPEADIRVAHGQLPERELEQIMSDFYHQRFNILLCSTIIESGIDVPTANTIVINRADRFGLAQLHQLRGRVGRSHHQAYAYLLTPPVRELAGDALKRLQAIEALEDLGAGFALASHDLEIRGAGELLGESQSGMIDDVGFTLYTEFLDNAIRSIAKQRGESDVAEDKSPSVEINLHTPALFPEDYLPDVHLRLVMYKRISACRNQEGLNDIRAEAIDRFGLLPPNAITLFRLAELRLALGPMGVTRVDLGPRGGRIEFLENADIDPVRLIELIQSRSDTYNMKGPNTLVIRAELEDAEKRIEALKFVIDTLTPVT